MKTVNTLIFCFFILSLQAQDYYYNGSEKVRIDKSEMSFISFDNPNSMKSVVNGFKKVETFAVKGFTILKHKRNSFSSQKFLANNLHQTIPALLLKNDEKFLLYPTKTLRVKLKPNFKITDIEKQLDKHEIVRTENKYGVLKIEVKNIHKVIEIANKIYESGISEYSIPDFYIPIQLNQVNDPLFSLQYQMHNTGQIVDGIAGVEDMDCNALEAWDLSLGDNVTVAIIDQGLEAHEDIGNRLKGGFSPGINGDGTPLENSDTHGMNCAGVVGASDNNLGIRGVAPNVDFLSVNIFDGSTIGDVADGIQWALDNGADILSNSWSFSDVPCDFTNIVMDNALLNAVNNGRNGDGAVVVFSAGNTGDCVEYPARNPNVISVGAINNRGNLYNYSSRGSELDLVAPSGFRFGDVGVRTLDRMGAAGNVAGNYTSTFDGTSAACPVVSGAAALVLSVNPNLTQQEVRDILTSTATDMGADGFDPNFGFGRVNAFAALVVALPIIELTGSTVICNDNTSFSLSDVPIGVAVKWSVSPNLQIVSSSSTGATIKAIDSKVNGNGFVKATVGGQEIILNGWIGNPSAVTELHHVPIFGCIKDEIDIASVAAGAAQYEWVIAGGTIVTSNVTSNRYTGQSLVFVEPTDGAYGFTAKVRAINSCGSSGWHTKYIPSNCSTGGDGITPLNNSFVLDDKAVLFSNPARETAYINLNQLTEDQKEFNFQIKLFDSKGSLVFEKQTNRIFEQINVSSMSSGIYILHLSNGVINITKKLVIQY